jgi:hypothetical protein
MVGIPGLPDALPAAAERILQTRPGAYLCKPPAACHVEHALAGALPDYDHLLAKHFGEVIASRVQLIYSEHQLSVERYVAS